MKKLILIRHAKSSWEYDVIDHERPLSNRGLKDATLIADYLSENEIVADKVLVSDATRTVLTSDIILPHLNIPEQNIEHNHKLYDFSGIDLVEVIKAVSKDIDVLMIFGHNHAITGFVNTYGNTFIDNVPTCGVVSIEFDIAQWSDIQKGNTVFTIFPRDLK